MRKRVLLWAMLCLFLSVTTGVYAVEDVQTTLSLPKTYQQKGGDSYPMSLAITLPTDYRQNLKTFSLSFLVDKSVRVDDFKLDGPLSDNDYRLSASKSDGPKQEIITLVIPDAKNVRGRELNLILNGKFKKGVKNINEVKMSYAYSVVDTKGKAKSIQRDVVSEKGQPKPSGLFTVDTIEPTDNTLTGKAPAKTRVRVFNGRTLIGSGVAKSNGTFAIVVNPQAEGSELSFEFALGKQNETVKVKVKSAEKIRTGSNPNRKKMQDYLDMVKSVPLKNGTHVEHLQINAAVATAEFALAKEESYPGEMASVQKALEEALKVARPGYMTGYPDKTFKPKNAMSRAEVSAVFTRILTRGEKVGAFSSFKDIDDSKWYASSVGYMEKKGLINGYQDGTFKPQKTITRAEFSRILAGYANLQPMQGGSPYKDVKSDHWASGYIAAVESAGLMSGRGDGRFAPSANITRQEVCAAINKALGREANKNFLDTYAVNSFKDVSKDMWSYYQILEATGQPQ
ncbi:hypothetical protein PEPCOX59622_01491 [Aedoeadaptatus coxii]|uniref:S-layer homology domain-containing protein n=1 Tax=Aedoeadaptatus coxii TaxID=755172 RepID=UPI001755913D|nr:S-layer homology domain-containing protein [Peptoniphilus coxii]CAC9934338.1 hypothetical protein PEPCOX59622_01491 [Peptoniphilus coxii]